MDTNVLESASITIIQSIIASLNVDGDVKAAAGHLFALRVRDEPRIA